MAGVILGSQVASDDTNREFVFEIERELGNVGLQVSSIRYPQVVVPALLFSA